MTRTAPINLADRRGWSSNGAAGFEFVCVLCNLTVCTSIRRDHFPSCLMCRHFCEISRSIAAHDRATALGLAQRWSAER